MGGGHSERDPKSFIQQDEVGAPLRAQNAQF